MSLLVVENLFVEIRGTSILRGISFAISAGETLGLVGESGSGKSMTALAVLGLLPHGSQASGSIQLQSRELLRLDEAALCDLRGKSVGMVFQEPMTALNPLLPIGEQVAEALRVHGISAAEAASRAANWLARVGLPPDRVSPRRYPHELSGGQRQRVMIAAAMALRPRLLIADEPTTALDVTTQARILELLRELVREEETSLLLITHDLAVVADMADRVAIMREGEIVERGPCPGQFRDLRHPYSKALLAAAVPAAAIPRAAPLSGQVAIEACNVVREYRGPRRQTFRAVDNVSLRIAKGERVGLVGESGSGKSTLARTLLGLEPPSEGNVLVMEENLFATKPSRRRQLRRNVLAVFQDPYGSFNPRHRIERVVAEPLHLEEKASTPHERRQRVVEALEEVGLQASDMKKFPHEFSGGQRQRIAIARALVLRPSMVIFDEPVSALDVSIRAQILRLLEELNRRLDIAYLFITHDLTVVRAVTDRVLVMWNGKIVEEGATGDILERPTHEYTRSLIAAAPSLDKILATVQA